MANGLDLSGVWDNVWGGTSKFPTEEWKNVETTIKVMHVDWDAEYKNIVNWKSNAQRDAWFDAQEGHVLTYKTKWNFKSLEVWKPGLNRHVGMLRTPIPNESAINYNFVYVTMGEQPVPGGEWRREHYFYFITSQNKLAPNTTELFLELDSITTFLPSVQLKGINLLRGHYPLALTPADTFLQDPLNNHYGLLEVEPGLASLKPSRVASQKFISFQKAGPRVVIATTADLTKPNQLWLDTSNVDSSGVPSDVTQPTEYWADRKINSNATSSLGNQGLTPVPAVGAPVVNGGVPSLNVYSLSTLSYGGFITYLRRRFPQVVKTIKAVYLLDSALIEEGPEFSFYNYTLKPVIQQNAGKVIETLKLTKDMFGYDAKYADFAKLYTGQFASILISNLNGEQAEVSVEDVAEDLQFYSRASAAFPFLKLEAFVNGIGGREKVNYAVKPWNSQNAELFRSNWEDFRFDLDVPTYAVFAESREIEGVVAQIERFRELKNAKVAKANNDLQAATDRTNRLSLLGARIGNENLRIDLEYTNVSDSITRNFTNESRNIATDNYSSIQTIGRIYDNTTQSLGRDLSNAYDRINLDYGISMDSLGVEYNARLSGNSLAQNNAQDISNREDHTRRWNAIIQRQTDRTSNQASNYDIPRTEASQMFSFMSYKQMRDLSRALQGGRLAQISTQMNLYDAAKNTELGYMASSTAALSSLFTSPGSFVGTGVGTILGGLNSLDVYAHQGDMMLRKYQVSSPITNNVKVTAGKGEWEQFEYNGPSYNKLEFDTNQDIEKAQFTIDYNTRYAVAEYAYVATYNNIDAWYQQNTSESELIRVVEQSTYTRTREVNDRLASYDFNLGIRNAQSTQTTESRVANRDNTVGNAIASRDKAVDTAITNFRVTSATQNIENTRAVENAINARSRSTFRTINQINDTTERGVIGLDYTTAVSQINSEYTSAIANLSADYNSLLFSEPHEYGGSAGAAWIDAWGQRGIDIRVKTLSKDELKRVGDTFIRNGYRTDSLWVEDPDLNVMTRYTYWQGEDAWIVGEEINETNKDLFRKMFLRGTTVWESPDEVLTDIYNNARRV